MNKTARKEFLEIAEHIKSLGFRVFVSSATNDTFGYYSDGNRIAQFQMPHQLPGVQIATCHNPTQSTGSGYLIEQNADPIPLDKLNLDYLKKGFDYYPDYFSDEDKQCHQVVKYINLEEFLLHKGDSIKEI